MTLLRYFLCAAAVSLLVLTGIWWYRSRLSQRSYFAPGKEVVWDDFGFQVEGVEGTPGEIAVELRVSNHARRASFDFRPDAVCLIASDGQELRPTGAEPLTLAAGESGTTVVHFAAPGAGADAAELRLFGGGLLGAIDVLLFGDRRLRLGPLSPRRS